MVTKKLTDSGEIQEAFSNAKTIKAKPHPEDFQVSSFAGFAVLSSHFQFSLLRLWRHYQSNPPRADEPRRSRGTCHRVGLSLA